MKYHVVEKFVSINGEGVNAGHISAFVRFAGCNLSCSFCDTKWANAPNVMYDELTESEIAAYVKEADVRFVTLTGGEPLYREGIIELLDELIKIPNLTVEFETNGSMNLKEIDTFRKYHDEKMRANQNLILFTMDYKLQASGMEEFMCTENFMYLDSKDTVKFVVGSHKDLERAKQIITEFNLAGQCHLYLSPVFESIDSADIVAYMIANHMNYATMQLQMHKFIWNPDQKGV